MNSGKKRLGAKFAAVLALVLSGLVLGAGPALAHDALTESNPEDGSTVKTLPDEIELIFNNNPLALGSVVRIEGPDGDVTEGKPKIVDETVSQAIAPGAAAGEYQVQWRVTSSDGHPISGEFSFTAEAGNEAPATVEPTAEATETTVAETTAPAETATEVATESTSAEADSGGTSPVLIITLAVLAVVILGAVVYVFVLAPKRSSEN
ncbi:copper resistance CopC family protein [Kineosporia babensis]|uniref:Copper resistance protein CopC n=1 Tax=Kineosporia babensis TaxID=499548 RepID=A0A9X1NFJ2_9ACTN|nr:copper resistance CopC family protein [Kineosporia babensis]MCD5312959.1 copper resistance protein CopC [Kineosporia babensis]